MDMFTLVAAHYLHRWWYGPHHPTPTSPGEPADPVMGRLVAAIALLGTCLALLSLAGQR